MARRYSKQQREDAAIMCAMAASSPGWSYHDCAITSGVETGSPAYWLAYDAWQHVCRFGVGLTGDYQSDAEAEAMIRTGWSPR